MSQKDTWTVGRLITWAQAYLEKHRIGSARLSAELMLAQVMGLERVGLYMRYDQPLNAAELAGFKELLIRRKRHEPMAYILGRREFWGLDLKVGPGVLVPRPETEHLVEEAIARLPQDQDIRILDLCTGSGAVALALAHELPRARVTAVDSSRQALAYANENAAGLEGGGRVRFLKGSLYDPVAASGGFFEMITANPPYVAPGEYQELSPEVRDWEPKEALWADDEGLEVTRNIIFGAGAYLRSGGWLLIELGAGQAQKAMALARRAGVFEDISTARDLADIERVLICQRGDYG